MQQETVRTKECHAVPSEVPLADVEEEPPSQCLTSFSAPTIYPQSYQDIESNKILFFPQFQTGLSTGRTRFRRKFFPGISAKQWNDWHWQVSHRIRTEAQLKEMLVLSEDEALALMQESG